MSNLAPNHSNFASAATTPALSATSSREDSPTSFLKSPDLQPGQLVLGEGEGQAKQRQQAKEEQPLPECWGHRGVRSSPIIAPLFLVPISSTYPYTYFAAPYGLD
jgi:hypothetical protein